MKLSRLRESLLGDTDAWQAYSYTPRGTRNPEKEHIIASKPFVAYQYAENNIKGRFPQAEPIIMKDIHWGPEYALEILKGRWPELEQYWQMTPSTLDDVEDDFDEGHSDTTMDRYLRKHGLIRDPLAKRIKRSSEHL